MTDCQPTEGVQESPESVAPCGYLATMLAKQAEATLYLLWLQVKRDNGCTDIECCDYYGGNCVCFGDYCGLAPTDPVIHHAEMVARVERDAVAHDGQLPA